MSTKIKINKFESIFVLYRTIQLTLHTFISKHTFQTHFKTHRLYTLLLKDINCESKYKAFDC